MAAWLQRQSGEQALPHLIPFFRSLVSLSTIYHNLLANVFTALTGQSRSKEKRFQMLKVSDADLNEWHTRLDSDICWNRWDIKQQVLEGHIALL